MNFGKPERVTVVEILALGIPQTVVLIHLVVSVVCGVFLVNVIRITIILTMSI
jgi:hypothetical protein